MAQKLYSWRDELREVADIPSSEPETDTKAKRRIEDKKVNNKIKINPSMNEAFEEIGGTIMEVYEIEEEDMGMLQQKRAREEAKISRIDLKIAKQRTKASKQGKNTASDDQTAQQVKEVLDMKKADMGDVVKDFYKSDAPQFKGKSKEKRREMAFAAKLQSEKPQ